MSESKIVIYIGRDALETVAIFDDEYPNLHNIFKSHAILCVDLNDAELDEILSDEESDLGQFCLKNDIKTIPLKDYFNTLREDKSQIVEKPRAMFFFDIPVSEAKNLSSKYGMIVQSEKNINDGVMQLSFKRGLNKGTAIEGNDDGWRNLLNEVQFPPMNSLIISDNFLFQNEANGKLVGFENLKMLLNTILPKTLETEFHLLILAPMPQKICSQKADQLNGMLKSFLKQIRSYDFQLEFVFNNTIHPRKIFSNYFVIVGDKGFQLFHPIHTTRVYDDNQLTITSVLHDTLGSYGDSELTLSINDIDKIKKSCSILREQIIGGVKDPTKRIIGDTSKDKKIKNRLMK